MIEKQEASFKYFHGFYVLKRNASLACLSWTMCVIEPPSELYSKLYFARGLNQWFVFLVLDLAWVHIYVYAPCKFNSSL